MYLMANIDYKEVGITEPERDVWEFEVTQEDIDSVRDKYILYDDTNREALVSCTPRGALALQIFIMCGSFKPGLYRAAKYSQLWHRYRPKVTKKEKNVETTDYAF